MNKKIMALVFAISILQSLGAESFDSDDFDPSMFDGKHTEEFGNMIVVKEPEEKKISIFDVPSLAVGYVYHTHLKPNFYAAFTALFAIEKDVTSERQ
ncbi:MAG: hypothetical protein ACJAZS_000359 [Alteromonas naphthalenivorans]|jgi:hypothetical protein